MSFTDLQPSFTDADQDEGGQPQRLLHYHAHGTMEVRDSISWKQLGRRVKGLRNQENISHSCSFPCVYELVQRRPYQEADTDLINHADVQLLNVRYVDISLCRGREG